MLNRIRRAVTLTRARHAPKGRHRRTLRASRPPIAPASPAYVDEPTVVLAQAVDKPGHRHSLRGEDVALVRPYMLVEEEPVRRRRTVVIAPYLPSDAWSTLLGAQ
ncbi:hypothetical protein GCM10010383_68270 [Streptomyces lomondensis]|uniref:Uncharacterized protein n=1 Tax=Streptomyces lomondensis TaxID=68229 RepID=A0ABQ2XPL7_9ACTN|nr:hypothetical protein GCM10010383_68270 [Streptomyces lomondensis]